MLIEMKYFLENERLGLKKLDSREHQQAYCDWLNTSEVTRFLVSGRFPSSMEDIESFVRSANSGNRITFAIYVKDTEKHIGNVKLDNIDWISRKADFGIMIGDTQQWGKGYGSDVTRLIVDYGFSILNLERIYLGVLKDNVRAIRTYEKIGFIKEGCKHRDQYVEGKYMDTLIMGITKKQWLFKKSKIVAIIQARVSSSRLPGKVLKPLLDKPMIVNVFERVSKSKMIQEVIIATSEDVSDNKLVECCRQYNIPCYRGDLNDVLKRYYEAAKSVCADIVVRVTGDCPLIDYEVIDETLHCFADNIENVDYASNIDIPTFPDGLDVEVFKFSALEDAYNNATLKSDREHVTPYIRKHMRKAGYALMDQDFSNLRWTVDELEDYELVKIIYDQFGLTIHNNGMFEILEFLEANSRLLEKNQKFHRNEGYEKSLLEDRIRNPD